MKIHKRKHQNEKKGECFFFKILALTLELPNRHSLLIDISQEIIQII